MTPRAGLLDPEGQAIHRALHNLEFRGVEEVRVGKSIYMEIEAPNGERAREDAETMCRKLLANPVTEDFRVSLLGEAHDTTPDGPDRPSGAEA